MMKGDDYTVSLKVTSINPGAMRYLLHDLGITGTVTSNHGVVTVHQDDVVSLTHALNNKGIEWRYQRNE